MKPVISVVIGSYEQKDILKRVLDGFQEQSFDKPFEVIIVDSNSQDGTKELLASLEAKFILKSIIQENTGKAAARNRGVSEAESELVIITDSDMIPDKDLIRLHYEAHQKFAEPVCFEGLTYNLSELHWPPEKEKYFPYISRNYKEGKKLGWFYFLTGNVSFPKSLFNSEGGFSQEFLSYGWEDLELGYRLFKKKVPLYYLKSAVNYHYHVVKAEAEIDRCFYKGESAKIFIEKHPELKLFLGINPLSKFIYRRIKKEGFLYRWMLGMVSRKGFGFRFSLWFLKEYEYLRGILGA